MICSPGSARALLPGSRRPNCCAACAGSKPAGAGDRPQGSAGQVFRYAVATGRADRDPTGALRGALTPWKPEHYPAPTEPKAVAELLRAIEGYTGALPARTVLRLAPMLFVRPSELRQMERAEIDFAAKEWNIPADKMKMRQPHLVPLSGRPSPCWPNSSR
jgi:integrase